MKVRTIPYGYKVENGKTIPDEGEARIVKRIFTAYINGEGLMRIADALTEEKVPVWEGNAVWSKNRIRRILSDERYVGGNGYPAILSDEMFIAAKKTARQKGFKAEPRQPLIEYLTQRVACGQCGSRLRRLQQARFNGSWNCPCGCVFGRSVTDNSILKKLEAVLQKVYRNKELLLAEAEGTFYVKTPEVIRYSNEIGRMIHSSEPSFSVTKNVILECAAIKFRACKERRFPIYTERVMKTFENAKAEDLMTLPFAENTVDSVIVGKSGDIIVRFMNAVEVRCGR